DFEKESPKGRTHTTSLEIRTIAAAITETQILDSRRSFENDRPVFFVRIRATVDLQNLAEAIRRHQSEAQLTEHFRQLQQENQLLRSQLQELQQKPVGVRMLTIDPNGRSEPTQRAKLLLEEAFRTQDLREKIQLASDAARLDPRSVEPLIARGQTYLRLVSLAFFPQSKPSSDITQTEKTKATINLPVQQDAKT